MEQDIFGFKLMFGMLMLVNPFLIFLDISRFPDPANSIALRFSLEVILVIVFIISHRIKKDEILRYQGFFFISTMLIYLFLLGTDYVMRGGYYELFLPNVTTLTIIINASFIGLRFRHSSILNLFKVLIFAIYAQNLSPHQGQKEQVVYLFVFYAIATILSYLFEKKNRELFLNQQIVEEKTLIIEKKNEELRKENDIRDSLLSILSHDVRGPLLTLESLLQLKKDNLVSEEDMLTHFQRLGSSVHTIRQFTERTILWIKSQMEGFSVKKEGFYVKSHISQTLELVDGTAVEKGLKINLEISEESQLVTDKEMFSIVFRNLLMNAIKFSHQQSEIIIRETHDYKYYKIHVVDEGVGISNDKKEALFSLETLSTEGTRKEKGTGLGLPLAFNLMKQLGGHLSFISAKGEGSTFTMAFNRKLD